MPAINYGQDYQQRQNELLSGKQSQGSMGSTGQGAISSLPATGIMRQAQTMTSMLAPMGGQQAQQQQATAPRLDRRPGSTNLNDIATTLAEQYGLPLGRTPIVDSRGNLTRLPANADEAVKMQYISQALADEQNRRAQGRAVSSLQAGIGLVQNRAPGSLTTMMSGQYGQLADVYSREQHVAQDFSYFVQKEQLAKAEAIARKLEKAAKKKAIGGLIGGILGGVAGFMVGGPVGAAAGYGVGAGVGGGTGGLF